MFKAVELLITLNWSLYIVYWIITVQPIKIYHSHFSIKKILAEPLFYTSTNTGFRTNVGCLGLSAVG